MPDIKVPKRVVIAPYWIVYGPESILGTVSQSGGTPTGAVIERGSNSNGEYVRFADGTQICTVEASQTSVAIDIALQGGFRSTIFSWTFPAAFVSTTNTVAVASSFSSFGTQAEVQSATTGRYFWTAVTTTSAGDRTAEILAVGRWF